MNPIHLVNSRERVHNFFLDREPVGPGSVEKKGTERKRKEKKRKKIKENTSPPEPVGQ